MKTLASRLSIITVLVLCVLLTACSSPDAQDGFHGTVPDTTSETTTGNPFQFDKNNAIKIDVPSGWSVKREDPSTALQIDQAFEVTLTPPDGEKGLLIITFGKTANGKAYSKEQYNALIDERVNNLLPNAVEKAPDFHDVTLKNGTGTYSIFTDASLVGKTLSSDEYLYVAEYFATYKNGCVIYASLLADDTTGAPFQSMLKTLSSVKPQFSNKK